MKLGHSDHIGPHENLNIINMRSTHISTGYLRAFFFYCSAEREGFDINILQSVMITFLIFNFFIALNRLMKFFFFRDPSASQVELERNLSSSLYFVGLLLGVLINLLFGSLLYLLKWGKDLKKLINANRN